MKKTRKLILSLLVIVPMLLVIFNVSAATLSASKKMTTTKYYSTNYSSAYMETTAKVSCPTTGDFKWTSRTASNDVHATLEYTFYNSGSTWSGSLTNKTTTYNWKWYALKLPTNPSGSSTQVGSGTGTAKFTYNSSTKTLSVK